MELVVSQMSPNSRIVLNILATYGRTLVGVACGIFSTRWVLMALGKEDFGLYGLIASLVIFMTFVNIQFAGALSRYYAFAVGEAKAALDPTLALEECRKWFSIGVAIHVVVPLSLLAVGYPVGVWSIRSGLVGVPVYRTDACVWLWRFVCISSLISMLNVPFSAMYTAKQYIAELTIYSFSQTIAKTAFIYYMTLSKADWLVPYGLATCLILVIPQLLICLRAFVVFPECRFRWRYIKLGSYTIKLASYALWQTFGVLGYLARHQFLTVVVNSFFGPKVTASFTIGGTVSGEAASLTGALNTAFSPAITTACGEGDWRRARTMAYQACKYGTILTLIFAIPMGLEMPEILRLWLKDVPQWANGVCLVMLAVVVIEKFTLGHLIGMNASGRIALFQVCRGLSCLTAIPFGIVAALVFRHVYAVTLALLITTCIACCSDVLLARTRIGLSARYWASRIILPLLFVSLISAVVGFSTRYFMAQSFLRVVVTTVFVLTMLIPTAVFFVLDHNERVFLIKKVCVLMKRFRRHNGNPGDILT